MQITLELLNASGLSGYAKEFFEGWFEQENLTEIPYNQALSRLKDNRKAIEAALLENGVEEKFDYYVAWFTNLGSSKSAVMFDGKHVFNNKWRVGSEVFYTLEKAKEFQKEYHEKILETKKQLLTISGITTNPNGTETYKSVNIIDDLEPEESDAFEFTVQETGRRRRTKSPTLAAIGLYRQKIEYDQYSRFPPMIEQEIQNGDCKAWTQIV